jgi:hypothetical protein
MKVMKRPIRLTKFAQHEIFIVALTSALFVWRIYRYDLKDAFGFSGAIFVLLTGINYWMNWPSQGKGAKTNGRAEDL